MGCVWGSVGVMGMAVWCQDGFWKGTVKLDLKRSNMDPPALAGGHWPVCSLPSGLGEHRADTVSHQTPWAIRPLLAVNLYEDGARLGFAFYS
jgi:hypothetical protein